MQRINTDIIGLLPILNTFTICLICIRMGIHVLFLPLPCTFTLAFIATEPLKGCWDKDFIANKALTILIDLDRIFILFKNINPMVTRHTQGNKVIHTVITAYTSRDFMMNIKPSAILFRRLATFLANFITFTYSTRNSSPSISVIDVSPAIVPMVFTYQPLVQMRSINKEHVGFTIPNTEKRQFKLFTTSAGASNVNVLFSISRANLFLRCIRMLFPIKVVMFSKFDSLLAFFGATCNQIISVIVANFKRLAANHTYFSYVRMVMSARFRAILQAFIRGCEWLFAMQAHQGVFTLSIVVSIFSSCQECSYALFRAASNLFFTTRCAVLKSFTTDDTRYLHSMVLMLVGAIASIRTELACATWRCCEDFAAIETGDSNRHSTNPFVLGYSSILLGRLVTKPALSIDDQSIQASSIIQQFGIVCKQLGYDPEEEAKLNDAEDERNLQKLQAQQEVIPPSLPGAPALPGQPKPAPTPSTAPQPAQGAQA